MRGYGLGLNLAWLLNNYWKRQRIVSKASKWLGTSFRTGRVVTQGYPSSPMILNIVVDVVVWVILDVVCSPQEAQHGMVWSVGDRNLPLYADDGRIAGWDHEWVQDMLMVTVALFCRMGI